MWEAEMGELKYQASLGKSEVPSQQISQAWWYTSVVLAM
jgi:hypothetical protein